MFTATMYQHEFTIRRTTQKLENVVNFLQQEGKQFKQEKGVYITEYQFNGDSKKVFFGNDLTTIISHALIEFGGNNA